MGTVRTASCEARIWAIVAQKITSRGFGHRGHDFGKLLITRAITAAINLQILSFDETEHPKLVEEGCDGRRNSFQRGSH